MTHELDRALSGICGNVETPFDAAGEIAPIIDRALAAGAHRPAVNGSTRAFRALTTGATSVGTLSIRRFLQPVCFRNIPADLLPRDLPRGPT